MKEIRDQVVIATKIGVRHNADRSLWLDSSLETIRKSVKGSRKKLGIDYIDLYYQYRIGRRGVCSRLLLLAIAFYISSCVFQRSVVFCNQFRKRYRYRYQYRFRNEK